MNRAENIAKQEELADALADMQERLENPQTEEDSDPDYREVILLPQRDHYIRQIQQLQDDLKTLK
ncbi:hypothetical protein D8682_00295 (plasmid) [Buttiauxella sp. 3AFRM03]|uniref:hypothetical protein n=1 Tax=Buttiauxella sp. 3AFRM03 TaxID=2479367 RepID=UPI000EF7AD58|nr:hypothetical protein [Buttiauxella sp. 3AFRM03]AYN25555.1 hypothetical protein D8682_00295 [Buttiauxella sp. 3AFRM03]